MRIYKAWWYDQHEGCLQKWFANKREAEKFKREVYNWNKKEALALAKDNPDYTYDEESIEVPRIEQIDFPTKKAEIIYWLNAHFDTNNG